MCSHSNNERDYFMSNIFSRMLCDTETVYESTTDIIIERVHRSKAVGALLKECGMLMLRLLIILLMMMIMIIIMKLLPLSVSAAVVCCMMIWGECGGAWGRPVNSLCWSKTHIKTYNQSSYFHTERLAHVSAAHYWTWFCHQIVLWSNGWKQGITLLLMLRTDQQQLPQIFHHQQWNSIMVLKQVSSVLSMCDQYMAVTQPMVLADAAHDVYTISICLIYFKV